MELVSIGPDHAIRQKAWANISKLSGLEVPIKMDIKHEHAMTGEAQENITDLKEHIRKLEENRIVNAEFTIENDSGRDGDLDRPGKSIN